MGIMKTEVRINGSVVTSYLAKPRGSDAWKVEDDSDNAVSIADVSFKPNIFSILPIETGSVITIKRGFVTATDEFVFEGEIDDWSSHRTVVTFKCKDKLVEAIKANITYSYDINNDPSGGVISEIFKDMINVWTPLVADDTSVTSTGVTNKLDKFIAMGEDVYDKGWQLANLVGYFVRYSPALGKVEFRPKGENVYPDTLTVGDQITIVPKWRKNAQQLVNKITVNGATQYDKIVESFAGPGTEFDLAKTPEDTEVRIGGQTGTLLTRGIAGSTSTYDYSVDRDTKKLTFTSSRSNIWIRYGAQVPIPVVVQDDDSIDTYGGPDKTPNEKEINVTDARTVADAQIYAIQYIELYKEPFRSTSFPLSNAQLAIQPIAPGDMVHIVDNKNSETINDNFVVHKVVKTYPHKNDKIFIGEEDWKTEQWQFNVERNIKKLLKEQAENQDLVQQTKTLNHRYGKKRQRIQAIGNAINDSFIADNPNPANSGADVVKAGNRRGGDVTIIDTTY